MSLKNLQDRIEKLEKARGVNLPTVVIEVHFIRPDRTEETLTPEETEALRAHKEKLRRDAEGTPSIPFILWTREQAQQLLADQDTSSEPTSGEREGG